MLTSSSLTISLSKPLPCVAFRPCIERTIHNNKNKKKFLSWMLLAFSKYSFPNHTSVTWQERWQIFVSGRSLVKREFHVVFCRYSFLMNFVSFLSSLFQDILHRFWSSVGGNILFCSKSSCFIHDLLYRGKFHINKKKKIGKSGEN